MSIRSTSPYDFPVGTLGETQQQLISAVCNVNQTETARLLPMVGDRTAVQKARGIIRNLLPDTATRTEALNIERLLTNRLSDMYLSELEENRTIEKIRAAMSAENPDSDSSE